MIEKIKQNPIKALGIAACIFFALAILCMLLPGVAYDGKYYPTGLFNLTMSASLFAFIFGGKVRFVTEDPDFTAKKIYDMRVNGMTVFAALLLVAAVILLIILIVGLFKEKFSNKKKIVLAIIIGVLVIASSVIIFVSKDSMIRYALSGKGHYTEATLSEEIKKFETTGKFTLGLGAVLTPIMMILGAGSIIGASILSTKKAK